MPTRVGTEWLADMELPGDRVSCAQHCGVTNKDDCYNCAAAHFMKRIRSFRHWIET